MKKLLNPILALIFTGIFLASCNPYKQLAEGQYLLEKVEVDYKLPSKIQKAEFYKKVITDDISDIIKQKPNNKLLGLFKFHLRVYSYGSKKDNKFRNWLKRIGEPPVILDTNLVGKSSNQMLLFLKKKGYFEAKGSDSIDYKIKTNWNGKKIKKKKAFVYYSLTPKKPWEVKNVNFGMDDDNLKPIIAQYSKDKDDGITIKRGSNYDEYKLASERERISRYMKNNGYFDFNREYIEFEVDTHLNKHRANYLIYYKNGYKKHQTAEGEDTLVSKKHKKYYIKQIIISMGDNANSIAADDTLKFKDYDFVNYQGNVIRQKVIARSVFLQKGDLYQLNKIEYTYSRLTALGVFGVINIDVSKDPNNLSGTDLIVVITLNMSPKYSVSFETEGTNRGGNLGVNSRVNFTNKNTFKGAESLNIGVFGGLEAQQTNNDLFEDQTEQINEALPFNTLEYGADVTIKVPDLLIPKREIGAPKYLSPSTEIGVAYNYQYRGSYDRDVLNLAYRYKWFLGRKHGFILSPIDISFVRLEKDSAFENRLQATGNSLLINSYQDHLIASTKFQYTFTNQESGDKNYVFFRSNIESAGNLLHEFDKLIGSPQKANEDFYTKFGIRYAQYIKVDGDLRYHSILTKNSDLVYRIYGGLGLPLTNLNVLPFEKSFFGGGANTNRAWVARTLGPGGLPAIDSLNTIDRIGEISIEANLEYRFDIVDGLEGAFFTDVGNVWLREKDPLRPNAEFNISRFYKELAVGVGAGLRIDLDFFIIRGDFAFKARDPSLAESERWFWEAKDVYKSWNGRRYKYGVNFNLGIGYPF